MKQALFFALFFLGMSQINAQLQDDFSDGNFDNNPTWIGNTTKFQVIDEVLQLQDATAESSNTTYLSVPALTSIDEETTWEFYFRLDFAPAAGNNGRIYLNASNSDLTGALNGYFIKMGGISGTGDALELYRQDGNSTTLLITGTAGALGVQPATAFVRVVRSVSGEWSLSADYAGGNDLQFEGMATDTTYPLGNFFGVYCHYTTTRSEHFFFDRIMINPLFQDTQAPHLLAASAASANQILVQFDEIISLASAENVANYNIDNGIGIPVSATIDDSNPSIIHLEIGTILDNLTTYTVSTTNIEDEAGNIASAESASFIFYNIQAPEENDLLITEIMADFNPAPPLLPEAEYIELYNNSDKVIQLEGLHFVAGTSNKILPSYLLLPQQYLIVCDDEDADAFSAFGETIFLATFPSLNNSGATLLLENESGEVIFNITYKKDWYADEEKEDGGWSLEMKKLDANYNCGGNWGASENNDGGTPGQINSLINIALELDAPSLVTAFPESQFEVLLTFDETLDPASIISDDFNISPNNIEIEAIFVQSEHKKVLLTTTTAFEEGVIYTVTVNNGVSDCLGNAISVSTSAQFGLSEIITPGDIIINEILFDPETGGKDFVELYNISNKILNLNGLNISNTQKETGLTNVDIEFDYLLFPQDYVVITGDKMDILERYIVESPAKIIQNSLPGFDNESGNITLRYAFSVIDSFTYNEGMHFSLLEKTDGISLERLKFSAPTQSFGNWHSAAASVGYATPTSQNSQFIIAEENTTNIISIPQPRLSPDSDGFEDVLQINYETDQNDYLINLAIYDATGRLVTRLATNELLGAQGTFKWDGVTNEGQKARLGIYIVWAEIFSGDGVVEVFKETCVVAGVLD